MKKILTMAAIALMFVVASCGNRQGETVETPDVDSTEVVVNDTTVTDTLDVVDVVVDADTVETVAE